MIKHKMPYNESKLTQIMQNLWKRLIKKNMAETTNKEMKEEKQA